jgi:hypothetical protein
MGLAHNMGFDLTAAVAEKMEINRNRRWVMNGDGTGHHHA